MDDNNAKDKGPLSLAAQEQILSRLARIDAESTRALRAVMVGKANDHDHIKLEELDKEADALRAELYGLLAQHYQDQEQ